MNSSCLVPLSDRQTGHAGRVAIQDVQAGKSSNTTDHWVLKAGREGEESNRHGQRNLDILVFKAEPSHARGSGHETTRSKGVGKGEGAGGLGGLKGGGEGKGGAPPDFKLIYYVYKQLLQKDVQNLEKQERKEQLSGYK